MKRLTTAITTLAVAATSAAASSYINAAKVDTDVTAVGTQSQIWQDAEATQVIMQPQKTISFIDANANKANKNNGAKKAWVKAIYNDENIAFRVRWNDPSYDSDKAKASVTDFYPDGFAMQFATDYSDPQSLPYIGMGQPGSPVIVHLQKALSKTYEPNGMGKVDMQVDPSNANKFEQNLDEFNEKVDALAKEKYQRSFIAEGFRSTTEIKDGTGKFHSNMRHSDGQWYATLTRPLSDDYLTLEDSFPVAIAAWDGEKLNRDGLKHITGWTAVKLENSSDELAEAINAKSTGDPAAGKKEFDAQCTACHRYPGNDSAQPYAAPVLDNIGGYSTLEYLRDSMMEPSKVVVPGYNRNQHPNNPWYTVGEDGERASTMPGYVWMSEDKIEDILAFLQTLKKEAK
ncbi:MAG: ethylbenzene dehydrogenase-related protein [Campylobacterota bacterium]